MEKELTKQEACRKQQAAADFCIKFKLKHTPSQASVIQYWPIYYGFF